MRSIGSVVPESIVVISIGLQIRNHDTTLSKKEFKGLATSESSKIIRFPSMRVISLLPKPFETKMVSRFPKTF